MVESTAVFCIHPDKYNNSVDRIISKEEEREDIQGEILQSIFEYSSVSTFYKEIQHSYKNYSVSTRSPATPSNSIYRINSTTRNLQEILQLQGSSRAGFFQ